MHGTRRNAVGPTNQRPNRHRRENVALYEPRDRLIFRGLPKPTRPMWGRAEETSTCGRCLDNPRHPGVRICRWCFQQEETIVQARTGELYSPEDVPTYIHCVACDGPTNPRYRECALCRGAINREEINRQINNFTRRRRQTAVGTYPIYTVGAPGIPGSQRSSGIRPATRGRSARWREFVET